MKFSVTDATIVADDYERGRIAATLTPFVVYVVKFPGDITATTIDASDFEARFDRPDQLVSLGDTEGSIPIKYSVNGGGTRLCARRIPHWRNEY